MAQFFVAEAVPLPMLNALFHSGGIAAHTEFREAAPGMVGLLRLGQWSGLLLYPLDQ